MKALRSDINIVEAMGHRNLFAQFSPGESWDGWRAILKAAYALPMTASDVSFFRSVSGGREPPQSRVKELYVVGGRRGGKDSIASLIIAFSAALFTDQHKLRPGEKATVMCLAVDREQAQIVLDFTKSYFELIPPFKELMQRETADGFDLANGVSVIIATNSYRAIRGRSILCGVMDECAFWQSEYSSKPDTATYSALKHGTGTLPSAMLVGISSPHKKSGLLYNKWRDYFGKSDDKVLVIQAPTSVLNPTIDPEIIANALEDDHAEASADYLAEWRDDLSSFIQRELIESAVDRGVTVRPYDRQYRYTSWIDTSSGQRDAFTCAVVHKEGDAKVLDNLVGIAAPFNTAEATAQIAAVLKVLPFERHHGRSARQGLGGAGVRAARHCLQGSPERHG